MLVLKKSVTHNNPITV